MGSSEDRFRIVSRLIPSHERPPQIAARPLVLWGGLNCSELKQVRCQSSPTSRIAFERRTFWSAMRSGFIGIVEDLMRLQLRCHSDIDLSQPGMQVEIRSHIARCLRDYPNGGEGVITLAGVEHCFAYVVEDDVVDTVIGPPDYIEQVFNEGRQDMQEGQSPLPRKDHD